MPTKIVSDLHSAVDALRQEVGEDDVLLLLGDLINIIDYTTMDGILVEIFGHEAVQQVIDLRAQRKFDEARAVMAERRAGREVDIAQRFQIEMRRAYEQVMDALPKTTFIISGNVDVPGMMQEMAPSSVEFPDGQVVMIEGRRVGFVGGALPTPLRVAGEIPEEEFDAKLAGLGEVDILCSHIPPEIPELTYDILAHRHERGSLGLLEYIKEVQPVRVYFGHIHQPMMSSTHLGKTHLINTGYFRRTGRATPLW